MAKTDTKRPRTTAWQMVRYFLTGVVGYFAGAPITVWLTVHFGTSFEQLLPRFPSYVVAGTVTWWFTGTLEYVLRKYFVFSSSEGWTRIHWFGIGPLLRPRRHWMIPVASLYLLTSSVAGWVITMGPDPNSWSLAFPDFAGIYVLFGGELRDSGTFIVASSVASALTGSAGIGGLVVYLYRRSRQQRTERDLIGGAAVALHLIEGLGQELEKDETK